jgi:hypothetical protein
MQKLKLSLFQGCRTGIEIDMLLHLSKLQDKYGRIQGVHYAEVAMALNISVKSFYDTLETLQSKGDIIVYNTDTARAWRWYQGVNIIINNNDFSRGEYGQNRYLNTNLDMLYQKQFRSLKAKEKQLVLNIMAVKDIRNGKRKKFKLETLMGYCGINNKYLLMEYIENIKGLLNLHTLDGMIVIEPTRECLKHKTAATETYIVNRLRTYCRQHKVAYILKDLRDIYTMIGQYGVMFTNRLINRLIDTSIKYGSLEPALINFTMNH